VSNHDISKSNSNLKGKKIMAVNYKGPLVAKTYYTVSALQHRNELSLNGLRGQAVGSVPNDIGLIQKSLGPISFYEWAVNYTAQVIRWLSAVSGSLNRIELWEYPEASDDGFYISTFTPAGVTGVGLAPLAPNLAQQSTISFRTREGGVAKWQLMETSVGGLATLDPYPFGTVVATDMAAFLVSADSPVLGRDTPPLVTGTNWGTTQNSKLFQHRYR